MRSTVHTGVMLEADPLGLYVDCTGPMVVDRRIDVQELHRALGEYLAETKCARCDGTGVLDDLIDRQAPCPDCRPDNALLTAQPQASACVTCGEPTRFDKPYCEEHCYELPQASAAQSAPDDRDLLVAEALRTCNWSGVPIGNKALIEAAIERLTARTAWQRAQSAPAGERDGFEAWYLRDSGFDELSIARNSDGDYVSDDTHACWEGWQARAAWQRTQSAGVPEGWKPVPVEPTEEMWGGLARHLMMWLDFGNPTVEALRKHLDMLNIEWPAWMDAESELRGSGVPSKGTRATLIYKAMLAAAPAQPAAQGSVRTVEVEIEGLGCCQLQMSGGTVFMPAVTVRDILRMATAAQDQGEVQRLREALVLCMDDAVTTLQNARHFEDAPNALVRIAKTANAALAASTGQEVKP